jgi:microcystin-dependent protein
MSRGNDWALIQAQFAALGGGGGSEAGFIPVGGLTQYAGATSPNANYAICDGASLSRTSYATLFARIGTTYGSGDGSTTFNLPNLKGRIPVGLDSSQTEFDALGETGGAKTHTLITSETPLHTHTTDIAHGHANTLAAPAHTHQVDPPNTGTSGNTHSHASNTAGDAGSFLSGTTNNYRYTGTSTLNTANDSHSHTVDIAEFTSGGASATALTGAVTNLGTTNVTSSSSGSDGAHNNLQPYIVMNYLIRIE